MELHYYLQKFLTAVGTGKASVLNWIISHQEPVCLFYKSKRPLMEYLNSNLNKILYS